MLVKQHQVGSHAHVTISRDITFMRTVRASGARRGRGAATPCSLLAKFGAMCRALSSDEMRDGQRSPHQKGPKLPESEARENGYHTHRLKATDNTHLIDTFWRKTHELDNIRNEKLLDVIPELEILL